MVNLDLQVDNRVISCAVSPVHASIIVAFEKKEIWSLKDLAIYLGVSHNYLRNKVLFWVHQGIL